MLETGYRRLVSAHHPDRNPTGAAKTVQLNRLIETLRSQLRESPQRVNGH
jgi:curved DNA-binding protein CbpA